MLRSREHQIRGAVPTDPQELVRNWGMTQEQAVASGQARQSFAAILFQDQSDSRLDGLYLDSKERDAFAADTGDEKFRSKIIEAAVKESKDKGLTASFTKMRDALKERTPAIHIHEQ